MFQLKARLLENIEVGEKYYKLRLACAEISRRASAGQFIEIRVPASEVFLRRPFSIHRARGGEIEVLYEVVGKGTEILTEIKRGASLDVIGPLGRGFGLPPAAYSLSPILVAGGMGVAPLVFLAEKLTETKNQKSLPVRQAGKIKNTILIGARTKSQILCEKEFKTLGCDVKIATDDGSKGFKGKVTDLLDKILRDNEISRKRVNEIYACGPHPMLKEVAAISKMFNIPAQISLEAHMACGIGACLGCMVKSIDGFKRVCKEGPVFGTDEIVW